MTNATNIGECQLRMRQRGLAALKAWAKALVGAAPFAYYLEEARKHGIDGEDPLTIELMREFGCTFHQDGDDMVIVH